MNLVQEIVDYGINLNITIDKLTKENEQLNIDNQRLQKVIASYEAEKNSKKDD